MREVVFEQLVKPPRSVEKHGKFRFGNARKIFVVRAGKQISRDFHKLIRLALRHRRNLLAVQIEKQREIRAEMADFRYHHFARTVNFIAQLARIFGDVYVFERRIEYAAALFCRSRRR